MNISSLLEQLDEILVKNDATVYELLKPGIEKEKVDEQIKELGFTFPPDVYKLYKWKNGITSTDSYTLSEEEIFPFSIFYSITDAIVVYKHDAIDKSYWDRKYFPLFSSGGGDYYLINIDVEDSQYGMIFMYSPTILLSIDVMSIFDSTYTLIESVVNCFIKNAFFFEDRIVDSDIKSEKEICLKLNPLSEYWKKPH